MERNNPDRLRRSRIFYSILFIIIFTLVALLLWSLQSLILPVLIGIISAYISLPALNFLIRKRIPKSLAVVILFGGFLFLVFVLGTQIVETLPNEREKLELRVNVQYKINQLYLEYLDKEDFDSEGNFVDTVIGDELYATLLDFNGLVGLSKDEQKQFEKYIDGHNNQPRPSDRVVSHYKQTKNLPLRPDTDTVEPKSRKADKSYPLIEPGNSKIAAFLDTISNWIVMPFVFLFLLIDDGKIKKSFVRLVPNPYFEMVLTTFDNVDKAIGNYLRGTLMECLLVGISFTLGLLIIGFDPKAATLIGIIAGLANAIPFLGPGIGLIVGLIYSMVIESVNPIIPGITINNLAVAVFVVVLIVQALDNALFAPVVLGKAVNLHPLVVILGVTGGSIIFGFLGMLFAVPFIVILKVILTTTYRQLKAYYIIY